MTSFLMFLVILMAVLSNHLAWLAKHSKEQPSISFPPEWHLWKSQHERNYSDVQEELSRHVVWLGNQEYINQHNKYADVFGYTLKMSKFGDLVSY